MRFIYIVLNLSLLFLLSCQSTESLRPPEFDKSSLVFSKKLTLESIVSNWDQSLNEITQRYLASKIDWQENLHKICLKQDNLCEFNIKNIRKKNSLNKKAIAEINKHIDAERFEPLQDLTVDLGLRFFGRYKKNKLMNYADRFLNDKQCKTSDLRHALASTLEDSLPNFESKNTVQALYDINSECPMSRTIALSTYRAAMLRLIDQDCLKATPLLEKVTLSSEDYLKPRSLYWSWRCKGESEDLKIAAQTQLPYFSYHRILIDDSSTYELLINETPVVVETSQNANLNEIARLAEKLLAMQKIPAARAVLEKIRVERVQETEPEFQVYWAHLLHLTYAGIKKFQILTALVNNYPQFRSKSIKNLLFPTSYFEHVEAYTKKIDPWLVQSLIRQESAFDPSARSRVGATGLMQLMPTTARRVAKIRGQLKDPAYNLHTGITFLESLVRRFDGQVHLALAAYNAGPGKVDEWQKRYPTSDSLLFVDAIPYRETRDYVAFILRNYYWYRSLNPVLPKELPVKPQSSLVGTAIQMKTY